ncbi:MAG: HAMP domain-containing protein [Chloroflexi bacterium]|nr:HAMP domain-containing protein [Chloroflexota bacterium]
MRFVHSLRFRLIIVVLVAILPALGAMVYRGVHERLGEAEAAETEVLGVAQLTAKSYQELLATAGQLLATLSQVPAVKEIHPAESQVLFADLMQQSPAYANIGQSDARGDVIAAGIPPQTPLNVADRAWFQRAVRTRGVTVGDYIVGRISGKPVVTIAYPLVDSLGAVRSVLFVGLDLQWLEKFLSVPQMPPGSVLFVIDGAGTVLTRHPEPENWIGRSVADSPIAKTILTEKREGTAISPGLDGEPRVYGFVPLGGSETGHYLAVGISESIAFARADRDLLINVLSLILATVLAVALAWVSISKAVLNALGRLIEATRRVKAGDLGARTGLDERSDELGELAEAFDEMAVAVKQRQSANRNAEAELKRSYEEMEQFVYVASHHLREPLRKVTSLSQLLEKRYGDKLDKEGAELITYIVDGASRMNNLIADLLEYSRNGATGKPFAEVRCETALGQALANLKGTLEGSGAIVSNDPLPVVMGDMEQITAVFENLLSNAVKFRSESPPRIHVSAEEKEAQWVLSVRDNGIGIATQHHERIFSVFPRIHTEAEYVGRGIGLAICKKIVERHGGRIWFESEPGKGSTFFFTLPAVASARATGKQRKASVNG